MNLGSCQRIALSPLCCNHKTSCPTIMVSWFLWFLPLEIWLGNHQVYVICSVMSSSHEKLNCYYTWKYYKRIRFFFWYWLFIVNIYWIFQEYSSTMQNIPWICALLHNPLKGPFTSGGSHLYKWPPQWSCLSWTFPCGGGISGLWLYVQSIDL